MRPSTSEDRFCLSPKKIKFILMTRGTNHFSPIWHEQILQWILFSCPIFSQNIHIPCMMIFLRYSNIFPSTNYHNRHQNCTIKPTRQYLLLFKGQRERFDNNWDSSGKTMSANKHVTLSKVLHRGKKNNYKCENVLTLKFMNKSHCTFYACADECTDNENKVVA